MVVVAQQQLQRRRGQGRGGRCPKRRAAGAGRRPADVLVAMVVGKDEVVSRGHRETLFQIEASGTDGRSRADWVLCDVHYHG